MNNISMYFGAPGCGKTRALMNVLSDELKVCQPNEIAYVSFTKKGTYEGRDRAIREFSYTTDDLPYFRTIHSLAFRDGGISKHNVMNRNDYKIFSDAMNMKFVGYYTEEFRHNDDRYLFMLSMQKNNPGYHKKLLKNNNFIVPSTMKKVAVNYPRFKEYYNLFDFDDMIINFIKRDKSLPVKVAIIDEAQDLTSLQWQFCEVAFRNCARVYIGGDDDQAIYEWNGADIDYFLGLKGKRIILDQSYRLKSKILKCAEKISQKISHRVVKDFAPVDEGGAISFYSDVKYLDIKSNESYYFLSRNNCFLTNYVEVLKRKNIVYWNKHKLSVDEKLIKAITIFDHVSKTGKYTEELDENILKKYVKNNVNFNQPWYNNFKLTSEDMIYYRALLKDKKPVLDSKIMLNTIHGVKGGEADNVVLMLDVTRNVYNAFYTNFDAELRCLYVACTRAKKQLHIVLSTTKYDYNSRINFKELVK